MKSSIQRSKGGLRARLEKASRRGGAVAFGVASVKEVDALPRIWIGWTVERHTVKLSSVIPGAKSVIVFGIPSTDDSDELETDRGKGDFSYPGYLPIKVIYRDLQRILTSEGYRSSWLNEDTSATSYKRIASLAGIGAFGKNSLILSPGNGPWLRFGLVLTDASLKPDSSFTEDMCGDCTKCIRACPAEALTAYKVRPEKCLVGVTSRPRLSRETRALLDKYEPRITPTTRVMCRMCQMVCPYTSSGRRRNSLVTDRL